MCLVPRGQKRQGGVVARATILVNDCMPKIFVLYGDRASFHVREPDHRNVLVRQVMHVACRTPRERGYDMVGVIVGEKTA